MNLGVVIPTYNEANSLPRLVSSLFALPLDLHVLVVDDDSPDGTGRLAEELTAAHAGRMAVLHRPKKAGLASAYGQGFRYFVDKKVDAIAQMDADFSHDPAVLVTMTKRLDTCDMVLGSRYIEGGSVDNRWSIGRKILSAWGNVYARRILGLPYRDVTTGYRVWRVQTINAIPLDRILSSGYIFQVEMVYLAHCLDYKVVEQPIHFSERQNGKTKMSFRIQVEAALRVWQILLKDRDIQHSGRTSKIEHAVRL